MHKLLEYPDVVKCKFKKGEYLIRQGEKVEYLYYLDKGSCYRTTVTEKGDEIIFSIKEASDNFTQSLAGVLILYSDGYSMSNFVAKVSCDCYRVPKGLFLQYVQDKPDLLQQLLTMAMSELRDLADTFQARQEGKVANRLCELLLKNSTLKDDKLLVSKDYSNNAVIGRFLGIHKVTVAKIIKALKEEGVILKERAGIIILDKERLTKYANAEKMIDY
jgi:CRP-like cAMP-binding protein